jgi:hypothetical protein
VCAKCTDFKVKIGVNLGNSLLYMIQGIVDTSVIRTRNPTVFLAVLFSVIKSYCVHVF